jgi:hypothetical protein
MALFKKDSSKQKAPAKKKGGVLGALGIQTEAVPTEQDKQTVEREKNIILAWQFLRTRIDVATHDYYRTGNFSKMEEFVERPALDAIKQHLNELRSSNILWSQPDRKAATQWSFKVMNVEMNKKNQPVRFVIRERYKDYSRHQLVVNGQLTEGTRARGEERVIEATVTVRNGTDYKLHSVRQVREATLS